MGKGKFPGIWTNNVIVVEFEVGGSLCELCSGETQPSPLYAGNMQTVLIAPEKKNA
jgi:hypothetical protein